MDVLLLFAIVFANARAAGQRQKSAVGWGLLTFAAFLVTATIFGGVFLIAGYKGPWTPEAVRAYSMSLQGDFLKGLTVAMFGVGGGLLVRYFLLRTPVSGGKRP